jgi:hypothetical protein
MNKFSLKTLYALFAIVTATLLAACGKGDNEVPNYGSLSIYNASPTLSTYDVYLNGSKLNAANLPYGGGVKYTQLPQGTYEAKFNVAGETAAVYTKTGISVANNNFSTLYLTGTTGNFDGLLLADDFSNTSVEKAYVRFVNLSPDAPALDLHVKDATSNLISNKKYKEYSGFTEIEAGSKTFEIKENTSGTVKTTLESTNFVKGYFYTIIAGGKVAAGTNERLFNGQIIQHR